MHYDPLDHQVDTLTVLLSHNNLKIHHITRSFIVIFAKIVKILRKLSRLQPQGVSWGVQPNFFLTIMIHLVKIYLFCDKTFVVRLTSDPKKLKLTKIGEKWVENSQNTPLGPFWGVRPKIFFYKMLHPVNMNIF